MITHDYVRMMATYNAEMNRRLYAAAAQLDDTERKADRGVFWKSLHGTLVHVYWGDCQLMARFDGWQRPNLPIRQSGAMIDNFDELRTLRVEADARIEDWANRIDAAWIDEDLRWFSGAAQREMRMPKAKLLVHFFNHQTHHRGQAHALLTARGQDTGDTDLFLVVPNSD
jgi:uncharacterized damage-inducible protein DinB